jgi:di/tricarboxylate transporter
MFWYIFCMNVKGIVCSYAFALPVATAPNAIVFGHSTMKTADMMKVGLIK